MTAAQSLKIYEILGKHFHNAEEARIVVTEIEQIIETKLIEKKDVLCTKEDLLKLQLSAKEESGKLQVSQKEMQIDMEKRFNQLTIWIVGVFIALSGLIIAVSRFK